MENDYFQNGNIKHNYNIIDPKSGMNVLGVGLI